MSRLPQHLLPAPDWPQGAWWSAAGYRSARTRFRVMIALLVLYAVVLIANGLYNVLNPDALGANLRIQAGTMPVFDPTGMLLGLVHLVVLVGLVISTMMWLSRSVENCWYLLGGIPERTPGWSVGWWFIPGANLVMPFLIVSDLNRRMARGIASPLTPLLVVWWVAGPLIQIVGGVMTFSVSISAAIPPGPTLQEAREFGVLTGIFQLVSVIPTILTLIVYPRIQRFADIRSEYAIPTPSPMPWGQPGPGGQWGPPPGGNPSDASSWGPPSTQSGGPWQPPQSGGAQAPSWGPPPSTDRDR